MQILLHTLPGHLELIVSNIQAASLLTNFLPRLCKNRLMKRSDDAILCFLSFAAMEGLGFLDALNSAPVPGIKIKKKKKVLSPTAAKVRVLGSRYRGQVEKVQGTEGPISVECWGRQEALSQT